MAENGSNFHSDLKSRIDGANSLADAREIIASTFSSIRQSGRRIAFLSGPVTPRYPTETRADNMSALALQTQEVSQALAGTDVVIFSCEVADGLVGRVEDREQAYAFWNSVVRGDEAHDGVDVIVIARNSVGSRGVGEEVGIAKRRGIPFVTIEEIVNGI